MEANNNEKTAQDIIFDFADMMANALGTPESPDLQKTLSVLQQLTALGNQKPVFVRKVFSEKMFKTIEEVYPKLSKPNVGILDLMPLVPAIKSAFDD